VAFGVRVARNTAAMFGAPKPITMGAMFLCRRFIMARISSMRKAAMLLLEPASPRDIQPPVSNIEKANPHQNSFFLQLDWPP